MYSHVFAQFIRHHGKQPGCRDCSFAKTSCSKYFCTWHFKTWFDATKLNVSHLKRNQGCVSCKKCLLLRVPLTGSWPKECQHFAGGKTSLQFTIVEVSGNTSHIITSFLSIIATQFLPQTVSAGWLNPQLGLLFQDMKSTRMEVNVLRLTLFAHWSFVVSQAFSDQTCADATHDAFSSLQFTSKQDTRKDGNKLIMGDIFHFIDNPFKPEKSQCKQASADECKVTDSCCMGAEYIPNGGLLVDSTGHVLAVGKLDDVVQVARGLPGVDTLPGFSFQSTLSCWKPSPQTRWVTKSWLVQILEPTILLRSLFRILTTRTVFAFSAHTD